MKKFIPLITILFLSSCENEPLEIHDNISSEENKTDNEQKVAIVPPAPVEKTEIKTPAISSPVTPSASIQEVKEIKVETKPIMPQFSDELLKAVNNWTRIPQSVFPLSAVTIKQAVQFSVKASNGQVMANSSLPAGSEVVVIGANGDKLLLAPRKDAKMRGIISMDETDFKEGVAYLFDLRKRQNEEYKEMMKRKTQNQISKINTAVTPKPNSRNSSNDLFEDIPIPGDFGHGKFCICEDCRTKRLAMNKED